MDYSGSLYQEGLLYAYGTLFSSQERVVIKLLDLPQSLTLCLAICLLFTDALSRVNGL